MPDRAARWRAACTATLAFTGSSAPSQVITSGGWRRYDVVADLQLGLPVDRLPGQPAVAQELAFTVLDHPQPEAVSRVVAERPLDPRLRIRPRLRPRVEAHHLFVPEQIGHGVEVVHRHRPEGQPLRGRQFEMGHGRKG
jgi:hypothetical protein